MVCFRWSGILWAPDSTSLPSRSTIQGYVNAFTGAFDPARGAVRAVLAHRAFWAPFGARALRADLADSGRSQGRLRSAGVRRHVR